MTRVALVAALVLLPATVHAHDPFQITAEARVGTDALNLQVTMLGNTAAHLCQATDGGRVELDPAAFAAMRPAFERCAPGLFRITAQGAALPARRWDVARTVEGDVDFRIVYPPPAGGLVRFDAVHLAQLTDPTYGAELTVTGAGAFLGQALLRANARTLEVDPSAPVFSASPPRPSFIDFLRLGVWHILGGADHLLFLAALLVAARRVRVILAVVTCFTLAHTVTLALATLDLVAPAPRVIEPLIAATIVFVGGENLLRPPGDDALRGRAALTFVFGLIHGFGFAGALRELGLGTEGRAMVPSLLAFNLGVELGQAAVVAVAVPLLAALRRWPPFARYGARAISMAVVAAGAYWLLQRTIF